MTEEIKPEDIEIPDPPMELVDGKGRGVSYQVGNETCTIMCWPLKNNGTYWEFKRNGKTYPLRLSEMGTNALVTVWHACFFANEDVLMKKPRQTECTCLQPVDTTPGYHHSLSCPSFRERAP